MKLPLFIINTQLYNFTFKLIRILKNQGFSYVFKRVHHNINQKLSPKKNDRLFTQLLNQNNKPSNTYQSTLDLKLDYKNIDIKYIAFYLPQYHSIKENDTWWSTGFTEWTNVTKSLPHFEGHYQPQLPDDLGFYNLGTEEAITKQITLAKQYGLSGFCIYYYWFSGKRLLEKPLDIYIKSSKINFPFCVCWANENWTRTWDGLDKQVLIKQEYNEQDPEKLITDLLPAFSNSNYIKINNRHLFVVYNPKSIPQIKQVTNLWRKKAAENNIELLLATVQSFDLKQTPQEIGFDLIIEFPPHQFGEKLKLLNTQLNFFNNKFKGWVYNYADMLSVAQNKQQPTYPWVRGVLPGWDNTARRSDMSNIIAYNHPNLFEKWLNYASDFANSNPTFGTKMVFINAWNEWAEGAHLEPDRKYGHAFLRSLAKVACQYDNQKKQLLSKWPIKKQNDTLVIFHLFHFDLLDEILTYLKNIGTYDLIITLPIHISYSELKSIKSKLPNAYLFAYPNKGRDIASFLAVLKEILPLNYSYLLKIHSKKSNRIKDGNFIVKDGELWRKELLEYLAGSSKTVSEIKTKLDDQTLNRVITHPKYTLKIRDHIGSNINYLNKLEPSIKPIIGNTTLVDQHFASGSFYWCKPSAISHLNNLSLTFEDFEEEDGQVDGTLAHALERLVLTKTIVKN